MIKKIEDSQANYPKFKEIDGSHPLKDKVPGSYIEYEVRTRHGGNVAYFNFDLAKEIGLLEPSHPEQLNPKLKKSILDTFSLVIINEYDIEAGTKFSKKDIRPNKYMATRYLQLQHNDRVGLSSGDGRSIWNGQIHHEGRTWDISSRGTGSTRLSPASANAKKFFKTGDPEVSYGCGLAEKDEAIEALFFSEVMHRNGVATERTLAIIEFDNGFVIGVRAYPSLLRPSHFFVHLKQGNLRPLEDITNFYIDHQIANKLWTKVPSSKVKRYDYFLEKVLEKLAYATAQFETNYIFCWMDWDGDNLLMDGGIIDYGSIRQFGLFHDGYRYDDDIKFSTTISEQRLKARYIFLTFIQLVHFLKTGRKKPIGGFTKSKLLKKFDQLYQTQKRVGILEKIGFQNHQVSYLLESKNLSQFIKNFAYFERAKSSKGIYKVEDGITHDAIFCMRDILRELPQLLLVREKPLDHKTFMNIIKSSYAKKSDLILSPYKKQKINEFQKYYLKLVDEASKYDEVTIPQVLLELTARSAIINKYDRITGDSVTMIASRILRHKPELDPEQIHQLLERFVYYQDLNPEKKILEKKLKDWEEKLLSQFFKIVRDHREWG